MHRIVNSRYQVTSMAAFSRVGSAARRLRFGYTCNWNRCRGAKHSPEHGNGNGNGSRAIREEGAEE
jgi:hypothetical protein